MAALVVVISALHASVTTLISPHTEQHSHRGGAPHCPGSDTGEPAPGPSSSCCTACGVDRGLARDWLLGSRPGGAGRGLLLCPGPTLPGFIQKVGPWLDPNDNMGERLWVWAPSKSSKVREKQRPASEMLQSHLEPEEKGLGDSSEGHLLLEGGLECGGVRGSAWGGPAHSWGSIT